MKPALAPSQRGIALIIVMISVTVLAILAGGFAYSMKVETRLARNANNEAELEWLGRSGVEYARWILAESAKIPNEPYDALNQIWAGGPGGIGSTNSPLADVQREVKLGNGSFTWKITDLERKANINSADEHVLEQGLMLMGVDAGDMTPIVNSILDWVDPDGPTRLQGAENEYYEGLEPPYEAKNGPIDDLSELLLVKGISPDLYWGPNSTNHIYSGMVPGANRHHTASENLNVYPVGFVDLFTPLSAGKININTASAAVLQLAGIDRLAAEAIVAGRDGEDDGSGLTGPYRNTDQVKRMPEVNPMVANILRQTGDIRSYTFEVQIDAKIGNYSRTFFAVLRRVNARDVQLLSFYWK